MPPLATASLDLERGGDGAHPDTVPVWNGEATSSSPFHGLSQGDEDIAAPNAFSNGWSAEMCPDEATRGLTPGVGPG